MKTGKVAIFTQAQTPMEFREYPIPSVTPDDMLVRNPYGEYLRVRPAFLARTRSENRKRHPASIGTRDDRYN